jgi:outer membrane protein OmpU
MNKLTKYGVSALCGSLAAISAANAGELSVTGGADMTWMSQSDSVTGNPLGIGSNYTFSGSGELDNGWSVALSIANANANAYSNTNITIGIPGLGSVRVDQGVSGTGLQRMDDMTPTVWEEADGAGLSAGITKPQGVSNGANIELSGLESTPEGLDVVVAFTSDADSGSTVGDKASGGTTGTLGSGFDLTLTANSELTGVDGLTLYGGISRVDQFQNTAGINSDSEEQVIGFKYAMGGFTIGWQQNEDETGRSATNTKYENTMYGITFNVNDDLSIGYGHVESDKSGTTAVTAEADSIQAAYTMGGATIRIAEVEVTNQAYSTAASADLDAHIVSLGLAF